MFFKSKPLKRTCRALSTFFLILHWLENERDGTVCRSYYVDHSCGCTQKQNKTPWFSEVLSWKGGARDLHSLYWMFYKAKKIYTCFKKISLYDLLLASPV